MPIGHIAFLALVIAAFSGFALSLSLVSADYTRWRARQAARPANTQPERAAAPPALKLAA